MSLAKKKNLAFFHAERDKKNVYNKLLRKYNLTADNILYVASSYSDIECLRMSGVSMCPEDAVPQVKNTVQHVIPIYSGNGVLCYIYELLNNYKLNHNREE
jgi:3-deoxy-D-manno-octulosonate 8-phosphate phosphatase KdsC-like HAD superfamily phosphatase